MITKKIFLILPVIISVIICVIGIIASVCTTEIHLDRVRTRLDKFDPKEQSSCRIIKNINTDEKYFKNETGKAEFCKLPVAEMRNKETYYKSGYKLTKKDSDESKSESDIEEYFGGRDESKKLIANLLDVVDSLNWLHIITVIATLVILFEIFVLLCVAIPYYIADKLRELDAVNRTQHYKT